MKDLEKEYRRVSYIIGEVCDYPECIEQCECDYSHENQPTCLHSLMSDALHLIEEQHKLLKEQETVDHALDILRANGWKKEEPICAHCEAIRVVQCRDCKHGWNINPSEDVKFYSCLNPKMVNMHWSHHGDWYCGDGVRRE